MVVSHVATADINVTYQYQISQQHREGTTPSIVLAISGTWVGTTHWLNSKLGYGQLTGIVQAHLTIRNAAACQWSTITWKQLN